MSAAPGAAGLDPVCEYADVPPSGYCLQHGPAREGDLAFHNQEGRWRPVRRGQNIVGACARELWDQGILALATRVPSTARPHRPRRTSKIHRIP